MRNKTPYEREILREMQDMPASMQEKIVRIVHFLKMEIMEQGADEKKATDEFLSVCGTWEDVRSPEELMRQIHAGRKSTMRTENIF